jgi:hypothetical protein
VGPLKTLALSPEGSRLVWLDRTGTASCLREDGTIQWTRHLEDVSRLAVGPGGRLTAAYRPGTLLQRRLLLLDADGKDLFSLECSSPLRCVAISRDGERVAVGTREGEIRLLLRKGSHFSARRIACAGPITYICFSRTNSLYFGTAAPAGVGRISAEGKLDWYDRGSPGSEYLIATTIMGQYVGVVERRTPQRRSGTLHLWDGRGDRIWSRPLTGWPVAIRIARGAARIVVGLERQATVGDVTRVDRSLACFSPEGERLWQKGGTFSDNPLLVTMNDSGSWIVSLGRQYRLYLLGDAGEVRWRESAREAVQIAVGSADGSSIGVAFASGRLAWFMIPHTPESE